MLACRDTEESYRHAVGALRAAYGTARFLAARGEAHLARSAYDATRQDLDRHVAEHRCPFEPLAEVPCQWRGPA
jgi:hypothetical protein